VLAAAQEAGMTPEELLSMASAGKRRRKRGGKRGAIAWRHPDDPSLVYRGGKKPEWVKELKEQGRGRTGTMYSGPDPRPRRNHISPGFSPPVPSMLK
jgi:hypothetical protein